MNKLTQWSKEISIVAVLWSMAGVGAFFAQQFMPIGTIQNLSEGKQELFINESLLTTITFAVAVFSGLIGSVLLLLKNKLATPILTFSVIVGIFQFLYNMIISKTFEVYGINTIIMPIVVITVGVFLVAFSKKVLSSIEA